MGAGVERGEERHSQLRNRWLPSVAPRALPRLRVCPEPRHLNAPPHPDIQATSTTSCTGLLRIPSAESRGFPGSLRTARPLGTLLPVSAPAGPPGAERVLPLENERCPEGGPQLQVTRQTSGRAGRAPLPLPAQGPPRRPRAAPRVLRRASRAAGAHGEGGASPALGRP